MKASIPVVALVQDVSRTQTDRNAFQDADHFAPDVAHDPSTDRWIACFEEVYSAFDHDIVARIYADTPPELQEWAGRQVHAHLLKLKAEGKVEGGSVKSAWKLA